MADIQESKRSDVVRITGSDENHVADVIQEDGQRKLLVKTTNVPEPIGNLFFENAASGLNIDMNVNGSGTPVEFLVAAHPTQSRVVNSLVFRALDGGIKLDNFLGQNSPLTNGLLIEVKSEDQVFQFKPIQTTQDFDGLFSFGPGRSFDLIFASGNDSMVARFGTSVPFVLKPVGTYATDDYIRVIIRDNLSAIAQLRFLAVGQLD